jgi:hypothetical protein
MDALWVTFGRVIALSCKPANSVATFSPLPQFGQSRTRGMANVIGDH